MDADPTHSFKRALGNVYAGFGIFGFAEIVREREVSLRKANNKLLLKEVTHQFNWSNLIRSIAILGLIFTIIFQFKIIIFAIITLVMYGIYIAFNNRFILSKFYWNPFKKFKTKIQADKKNLLVLQDLPAFSFANMIYLPFILMRFFEVSFDENSNSTTSFKIYFSISLFIGILIYGSAKKVSKVILNKAKQLYPEAFA